MMSEHQSSQAWIIGLIVVIALAVGAYFFLSPAPSKKPEPPVTVAPPEIPVEPEPEPEPEPREPVSPAPSPEPARELPTLNDSDEAARADLLSLATNGALTEWLVSDEVIRKWVAAVNAASQGELMHKHRPLKNIKEPVAVTSAGATGMQLSEENYRRYDPLVRIFVQADTDSAIELYSFWYPRLEQAYGELGIKDKNFHQVLLLAIDKVLSAPEAEVPILLVRPSVYYKFADPELEKLPGIHKLMIRMGSDNAQQIKEKLREIGIRLRQLQP